MALGPEDAAVAFIQIIVWCAKNMKRSSARKILDWIVDEVEDEDTYVYCRWIGPKPDDAKEFLLDLHARIKAFLQNPVDEVEERVRIGKRDAVVEWVTELASDYPDDLCWCVKFEDMESLKLIGKMIEELL